MEVMKESASSLGEASVRRIDAVPLLVWSIVVEITNEYIAKQGVQNRESVTELRDSLVSDVVHEAEA